MDPRFPAISNEIEKARSQVETAVELVALQEARVAALKAKGFPTNRAEAFLGTVVEALQQVRRRLSQLEAIEGRPSTCES
jgi:hypothetical protein